MKTIIISMPKAGTYLCSNLLVELGIVQSYMHLNANSFQKYRANRIEEAKKDPGLFTRKIKFKDSIGYVKDGHFAVSHVGYNTHRHTLLEGFKKIILIRNPAEIRESFNRWNEHTGRKMPRLELDEILKWTIQPDTYTLSFNDMINKNTDKINGLQTYLFGEVRFDSDSCMTRAIQSPSMTKMR